MIVGLNLQGSEKNPSCWFSYPEMKHGYWLEDGEIISGLEGMKPEAVVIEMPLSTVGSPGMLLIRRRAERLAEAIRSLGIRMVRCDAKKHSFLLEKGKLKQTIGRENKDIREAAIAAILGSLYLKGIAKCQDGWVFV